MATMTLSRILLMRGGLRPRRGTPAPSAFPAARSRRVQAAREVVHRLGLGDDLLGLASLSRAGRRAGRDCGGWPPGSRCSRRDEKTTTGRGLPRSCRSRRSSRAATWRRARGSTSGCRRSGQLGRADVVAQDISRRRDPAEGRWSTSGLENSGLVVHSLTARANPHRPPAMLRAWQMPQLLCFQLIARLYRPKAADEPGDQGEKPCRASPLRHTELLIYELLSWRAVGLVSGRYLRYNPRLCKPLQ